MKLRKYSFGIGDRFGRQGIAQLKAIIKAHDAGVTITPVWNKSFREHEIIGTDPADVRKEADRAVDQLGWSEDYFVDADHITMDTVDLFLDSSDFFTIDVAESIGKMGDRNGIMNFLKLNRPSIGEIKIDGMKQPLRVTETQITEIAEKYFQAISEAAKIFRNIKIKRPNAIIEVSMDEVDTPQTPTELFFILKNLLEQGVALDTIAPKFTGRFNKGVDYQGSLEIFTKEFEQSLLIVNHMVNRYQLVQNLKLSVHSGSDKFSLYETIHRLINKHNAGLHLKTSGTTWLEEVIGLVQAGVEGELMVKQIYSKAFGRFDELIRPYRAVTNIDKKYLPKPDRFGRLNGREISGLLYHDPKNQAYNTHFRQFMHCAYRIAAEFGREYTDLLERYQNLIGPRVTENLFERHIKPIFMGS